MCDVAVVIATPIMRSFRCACGWQGRAQRGAGLMRLLADRIVIGLRAEGALPQRIDAVLGLGQKSDGRSRLGLGLRVCESYAIHFVSRSRRDGQCDARAGLAWPMSSRPARRGLHR